QEKSRAEVKLCPMGDLGNQLDAANRRIDEVEKRLIVLREHFDAATTRLSKALRLDPKRPDLNFREFCKFINDAADAVLPPQYVTLHGGPWHSHQVEVSPTCNMHKLHREDQHGFRLMDFYERSLGGAFHYHSTARFGPIVGDPTSKNTTPGITGA